MGFIHFIFMVFLFLLVYTCFKQRLKMNRNTYKCTLHKQKYVKMDKIEIKKEWEKYVGTDSRQI